MYFYLKAPLFAPVFGLFAAKCSAICGKTQCILVLNGRRFGAKRKAKCRKIQNDKHKNTLQWYKHNLLEPRKTWLEWAK